ncbi:MAG TPA: hypothetical protein VKP30_13220, partial [Polyangiaceae bacterium]|nr:hypothetical protein [Polyangiaceae bacterium]
DPLLDLLIQTHWDSLVETGRELLLGPMHLPRMLEKVGRWMTQLEPIVAQDPTLDLASWKAEVASFSALLEIATRDFEAFLAEGLIEEQEQPAREW